MVTKLTNSDKKIFFQYKEIYNAQKNFVTSWNCKQQYRRTRLNKTHTEALNRMLTMYANQLNDLSSKNVTFDIYNLPAFRTYVCSLAQTFNCTDRTIENILDRLKSAGAVTHTRFQAGNGYMIHFCPELILKGQCFAGSGETLAEPINIDFTTFKKFGEYTVTSTESNTHAEREQENKNFSSPISTLPEGAAPQNNSENFSGFSSCTTSYNLKNNTESLATSEADRIRRLSDRVSEPAASEQVTFAGNGNKAAQKRAAAQEKCPENAKKLQLVRDFYEAAFRILYPMIHQSDESKRMMLNILYRDVFNGFSQKGMVTFDQWTEFYLQRVKLLESAKEWLESHPEFKLPSPELYFSAENTGKVSFRNWYRGHKKYRNQQELSRMRTEIYNTRQQKGRFKAYTLVDLFQVHKNRVSKIGDSHLTLIFEKFSKYAYNEKSNETTGK